VRYGAQQLWDAQSRHESDGPGVSRASATTEVPVDGRSKNLWRWLKAAF
jgi:hypothetical protein